MRNLSSLNMIYEDAEETMSKQNDLFSLTNRVPFRNVEIYPPNEYYGADLIYKSFLNINSHKTLYFAIPHGLEFFNGGIRSLFAKKELLALGVYFNDSTLDNAKTNRFRGVLKKSVHPLLILESLLQARSISVPQSENPEMLIFPAHTTPESDFTNPNYDSEIISTLLLNGDSSEYTIIFPSFDIRLGRHINYQKSGFKVVSAGDIGDSKFICRLMNLINLHAKVGVFDLGSHIAYAAAFKDRIYFLGNKSLALPPQRYLDSKSDFYSDSIHPCFSPLISAIESGASGCMPLARALLGDSGLSLVHNLETIQKRGKQIYFFGSVRHEGSKRKYEAPLFFINTVRNIIKLLESLIGYVQRCLFN